MHCLLRDDFKGGGAEEAVSALDTFLHNIITYKNQCVEQFGALTVDKMDIDCHA